MKKPFRNTFFLSLFIQILLMSLIKENNYAMTLGGARKQAGHALSEEELDKWVTDRLAQMSLKEKVYEMHGHGMLRYGIRMLLGLPVKPVRAGGSKRLGIPELVFLDGPRGVSFVRGATAFPVTMARGASWDPHLEERIGEAIAREMKALGANYSGAVCMNLLRHPGWGRAQETYGEDPYHVGEMAVALVKGIQRHRVQACLKHFAANSMENNRFGGNISMDIRTLYEVYLPHFRKAVHAGAASVMSAYNKLNGEYCGHHKFLLTNILRNEWGFKGYVTSDWMDGLHDAVKGIQAGMQVEMPSGKVYSYRNISKLLREGRITMQQIDELIYPVLRTKKLFSTDTGKNTYPRALVGCREHRSLAREAAEKSMVLLKNENHLLPLNKVQIHKLVITGSLADIKETGDHGSSWVKPRYVVSALEGIRSYLQNENTKVEYVSYRNRAKLHKACSEADAVIVIAGTTYRDEGEYIGMGQNRRRDKPHKKTFLTRLGILGLGGDRPHLHLHPHDVEAIQAASAGHSRLIVCLIAGSAITVEEWQQQVGAILHTFYGGMEFGHALARVLFGEVNPSGKLPFTVPADASHLPPFDSYAEEVHYGYYHGYTLFDKTNQNVRYPFGFGLSYTTFEISELALSSRTLCPGDTLYITAKVKNTGNRSGAEVVQLYIGFGHSTLDRPVKLLRGFQKVYLQPAEHREVAFIIKPEDISYYDPELKMWRVENMPHQIWIGKSSRDNHFLSDIFTVEGFE
ncbi:MAG: glycosyl hydrolase [Chitinophagales bacterium]|nr:MAG: glycosyl hydrolase [Chitinophagales bacterium]